jgi:parvulin-like peptidyl-prolyl isomerase
MTLIQFQKLSFFVVPRQVTMAPIIPPFANALTAFLSSVDGTLDNDEKAIEKRGQVGVGQAGVQATLGEQLLSNNQEEKEVKRVECHYIGG